MEQVNPQLRARLKRYDIEETAVYRKKTSNVRWVGGRGQRWPLLTRFQAELFVRRGRATSPVQE
jgi:hypothetical protein